MRERWPIWKGVAALIEHVVSASLDFHHVAVFVDNIDGTDSIEEAWIDPALHESNFVA